MAPGQPLPEPLPQVLAFVVTPGGKIVVLGTLSPGQVKTLLPALARQRIAHAGTDSRTLVLVGLLTLIGGGALLGLSAWRRRTAV